MCKKIYVCLLFVSVLFSNCKTSQNVPLGVLEDLNAPIIAEDVYSAGEYFDGFKTVPCYWLNETRIDLSVPNLSAEASAKDITLSGGSVYVSGFYNYNNRKIPCYWKDGERVDLEIPRRVRTAAAYSIEVSGGSVYAAGFYHNSGKDIACLWVDGIRADLDVPGWADISAVFAAAVYAGDIYLGGFYGRDNGNTACFWKNGERTDLPVPADSSSAAVSAIAILQGKVYTAGSYFANNGNRIACYWENNKKTELDVPLGTGISDAVSIAVDNISHNGETYFAGFYSTDGVNTTERVHRTACYWLKGGRRIDLEKPDRAYATSLFAGSGSIFVSGVFYEDDYERNRKPCYWKNGVKTELPIPKSASFASANAVFAVK